MSDLNPLSKIPGLLNPDEQETLEEKKKETWNDLAKSVIRSNKRAMSQPRRLTGTQERTTKEGMDGNKIYGDDGQIWHRMQREDE